MKKKIGYSKTPKDIAAAIEKAGAPLPQETLALCEGADAILFGAVGDPKYDDPAVKIRPEQGLLALRKELNLYANIRPTIIFDGVKVACPIKDEVRKGVDFIVVRELTGGIYFGQPRGRDKNVKRAIDSCVYTEEEIMRVSKIAFDVAKNRLRKVTLVDKANVLETSRLWREVVATVHKEYPQVTLDYMYVDNAAMQIIKNPTLFDVILTENMFGDILTDEASVLCGSLGLMPSASIGTSVSLFEPIHGSYPQAAGRGIANPVGALLSAAMMLDYSFGMKKEALALESAVKKSLESGFGTEDIVATSPLGTGPFVETILQNI